MAQFFIALNLQNKAYKLLKTFVKFIKESYDKVSVRPDTADNTFGFAPPVWLEIGRAGSGEV